MERFCSLLLTLALMLGLAACGQTAADGPAWQEQYDLGVKYLSEGNYEEAVIAFTAAIEIDPKKPDAYIGLADAHTARGDTMAALDVLNQALGAVGESDALSAALEKLRGEPRTSRADSEDGSYWITEYDADGNRVRSTHYNADGTPEDVNEYDADGNMVRSSQFNDDGKPTFITEYDADGNIVHQTQYDYYDDGKVGVSESEYENNVRRTVHIITYYPDGTVYDNVLKEYDAEGKDVRVTWYNADGTARDYLLYEHDAEGRVVRENIYSIDGTPTVYWVREYDDDGNLVRRTQHEPDGTPRYVEEYDDDGHIVRRTRI